MLIPNFAFIYFSHEYSLLLFTKSKQIGVKLKRNLETRLQMLIKVNKYADSEFRIKKILT